MSLRSELLRDDPRLQSCLTHDASHLVQGTVGSCVARVQTALFVVDGLRIERDEIHSKRYGSSTANAVLAFKTRRKIINHKYQTKPDNIVGKMTIAALDEELLKKERYADCQETYCGDNPDRTAHTQVKFTSGSAFAPVRLGGGPAASGGVSAAAVAKTRAPGGIVPVAKSRSVVGRLLAFQRHPSLPIPPGILVEFDFLWSYFGMPKFPLRDPVTRGQVDDLETYLLVIDKVLEGMATNLGNASTLFRDPPGSLYPEAYAFTLGPGMRGSKEPPKDATWPDGMYFNSTYLLNDGNKVGPLKQTEVAIHECAHFVQNEEIQDYVEHVISWAYGYSGYVLHCGFGRSKPFAENE